MSDKKSKKSDKSSTHTVVVDPHADEPTSPTVPSKKTPAAAYAERAFDGSPVSALFATSTGDSNEIILRSSDSYDFHVNRFILKLGSPALGTMMGKSRSEDGSGTGTGMLMLAEPACILDVLLTLLYPVEPPTWTSLEGFGPVLDAAIRYDMRGAVETLRQALISPRRVDDHILPSFADLDPLRVFAISRQAGLEAEAEMAKNATKGISLRNSEMSAEVENMPTKYYRELINVRDDRGHWKETFKLFKGVSLRRTGGLTRMGSMRSTTAPSFMGKSRA